MHFFSIYWYTIFWGTFLPNSQNIAYTYPHKYRYDKLKLLKFIIITKDKTMKYNTSITNDGLTMYIKHIY